MSDDCRHWTTPRWLQTIYERFCTPFTAWTAVASDGTTPSPLNLTSAGNLKVDIGSSVQIDQVIVDLSQVEEKQDISNSLLTDISANTARTQSFSIPSYTSKTFTSSGGNITQITYFNGATQVAHRTLSYSAGVITGDTLSIP